MMNAMQQKYEENGSRQDFYFVNEICLRHYLQATCRDFQTVVGLWIFPRYLEMNKGHADFKAWQAQE